MVYLIDTCTNELKEVEVNGIVMPIIRHNQKLIEKSYPVMTVTERDSITYFVCDFIRWKKLRLRKHDVVLRANILYDESILIGIEKALKD